MLQGLVLRLSVHSNEVFSQSLRLAGTFNSLSSENLWKSTSPQTKRTGRGKRARIRQREDFSADHMLGEGDAGILWPGLNTNVENPPSKRTPEEQEAFLATKNVLKDQKKLKRTQNFARGWTGGHYGGIRLGAPESIDGHDFSDFESIVMDVARVSHMTAKIGRVYSTRAIVAVGNGKGLVGFGHCVATNIAGAFRKARQKAVNRLVYVERFEDRTVYEDLYVNHHHTWLSIRQQPEGYGVRSHRALKDMCELIGYRDIYIKVTGSSTMLPLLKCFMKGILSQETHQQKADRLGYHVVEFDELRGNVPRVLASPQGQVSTEPHDEYEDYLKQELIARDARMAEGRSPHYMSLALATDNRGLPTPASCSVPDFLKNIRNLKVD